MNCPDKANFFCDDGLGRSVARVGTVEAAKVWKTCWTLGALG